MLKKMIKAFVVACSFVAGGIGAPALADTTELVVVSATVNPVMQPEQPVDVVKACAGNVACRSVIDAAAAYAGVPPGLVGIALAAIPEARREGEEGHYRIELPTGYQYCHARIHTISVVPATGDRASVMGVSTTPEGVGVYTWTPELKGGEGRSWVEADFTIIGVRNDLADSWRADGKCRSPGTVIMNCRGAKGINKGMPACGSIDD